MSLLKSILFNFIDICYAFMVFLVLYNLITTEGWVHFFMVPKLKIINLSKGCTQELTRLVDVVQAQYNSRTKLDLEVFKKDKKRLRRPS